MVNSNLGLIRGKWKPGCVEEFVRLWQVCTVTATLLRFIFCTFALEVGSVCVFVFLKCTETGTIFKITFNRMSLLLPIIVLCLQAQY